VLVFSKNDVEHTHLCQQFLLPYFHILTHQTLVDECNANT